MSVNIERPQSYEFTSDQNQTISKLSLYMRIISVLIIFVSVVNVIGFDIGSLLSSGLFFMIGLCTWRAADSFNRIVTTEGFDIGHLMEGMENLRNIYLVQVILSGIVLIFMIIVAALALSGA